MSAGQGSAHVDPTVIERYGNGTLDVAAETWVEDHLLDCAQCRARVAAEASPGRIPELDSVRLDRVWREVVDVVDAPRAGIVERGLRLCGVSQNTARLLGAAPSLRLPWLLGIALTLGFALIAAGAGREGVGVYLALAPILPVAGVAAAYAPPMDPLREVASAAPYPAVRIVLLRAVAVLGATIPLVLITGLALPSAPVWVGAAWLLPALSFTTLTLLAGTVIDPLAAAIGISAVWVSLVTVTSLHDHRPLQMVGYGYQIAFLGLLVTSAGILFACRGAIAEPRGRT
jgi:hypothetical protein